jgi:multidrug efflux system outer membrane protein
MKRLLLRGGLPALVALLSGCTVGPDYHRPPPAVTLPMDWHWKKAEPSDDLAKGPWWELFRDAELTRLEQLATAQNQDLKGAVGRVDEARARARLQGASFFPRISANPSYTRTQLPADNPQFSKIPIPGVLTRLEPYNSFSVPLDLSYEIDLWGRVRRSFQAAQAQAQASVADYQNVLLTLNSDVAVEYLTLREYDSEIGILNDTVTARTESLRINKVRVEAGRATNVDVAQASTDLTNAEAQLAAVEQSRAETQDALAVLCGTNASDLNLLPHPLDLIPPSIPVGLPASLLERRPDVAEAERTMAAKNAQIGVAYAAGRRAERAGDRSLSLAEHDLVVWPEREHPAFRWRPESLQPADRARAI